MTTHPKCQVPWGTSDALEQVISALGALTTLLVNALHYESGMVSSTADGLYILMNEKIDALRDIAASMEVVSETKVKPDTGWVAVPELNPDEVMAQRAARSTKDTHASLIAEEVETLRTAQAFADREPIDAAEIAAAFKVDPEVVERIVSELSKAKAPAAQPGREGRRGRAATS